MTKYITSVLFALIVAGLLLVYYLTLMVGKPASCLDKVIDLDAPQVDQTCMPGSKLEVLPKQPRVLLCRCSNDHITDASIIDGE